MLQALCFNLSFKSLLISYTVGLVCQQVISQVVSQLVIKFQVLYEERCLVWLVLRFCGVFCFLFALSLLDLVGLWFWRCKFIVEYVKRKGSGFQKAEFLRRPTKSGRIKLVTPLYNLTGKPTQYITYCESSSSA